MTVFQKFKNKYHERSQGKKDTDEDIDIVPKNSVLSKLEKKINDEYMDGSDFIDYLAFSPL